MLLGLPVVGLATTELVTVIQSGHNGFIDTRPEHLVEAMEELLSNRSLALEWERLAGGPLGSASPSTGSLMTGCKSFIGWRAEHMTPEQQ